MGCAVSRGSGTTATAPRCREYLSFAPIVIEDAVWIGTPAVITQGVTIGVGAVVVAGAVVTDIPAATVVAGAPARVIKKID